MCVEKLEMNQENETVEKPPPTTTTDRLLSNLTHLAHNIYDGMEYVGEVVAGMLGLDDSKFQDVIDNMTEEDWRIAIQVDKERRLQDAIREALEQESRKYIVNHQSIEDGTGTPAGHALYTQSSLPQEDKSSSNLKSDSDVTEFEILKNSENEEPSYRPDGGFGYLSPEEVKIIKERVTAEFLMKESLESGQNPEPSGPLQDVMIPRNDTEINESEEGVSLKEIQPSL